jgi:hypothetical protein
MEKRTRFSKPVRRRATDFIHSFSLLPQGGGDYYIF